MEVRLLQMICKSSKLVYTKYVITMVTSAVIIIMLKYMKMDVHYLKADIVKI